jgi:hypothetical protein
MNEKLSVLIENVIIVTFLIMSIATFTISIKNLGIVLGILLSIVICGLLLFAIAAISSMFTPNLFPYCEGKKESLQNKDCEKGDVICSIQKKTKEAILQYLKCRDTQYLENNLQISQISSGKEYKEFCEQRDAIKKSNDEKSANEKKLKYVIKNLFVSIPEKEIWFKIRLFDQEFGISKQLVDTKKFDEHGNKVCIPRRNYTQIMAIYIKPWSDSLSYDRDNDSYAFCESYYLHTNAFHIANKERIDIFVMEHMRKELDDVAQ